MSQVLNQYPMVTKVHSVNSVVDQGIFPFTYKKLIDS